MYLSGVEDYFKKSFKPTTKISQIPLFCVKKKLPTNLFNSQVPFFSLFFQKKAPFFPHHFFFMLTLKPANVGELRTSKNSTTLQAVHLSPSTSIATTISSNPSAFSMLLTWHNQLVCPVGPIHRTSPDNIRPHNAVHKLGVKFLMWALRFFSTGFFFDVYRFLKGWRSSLKKTRTSPCSACRISGLPNSGFRVRASKARLSEDSGR